MLNVMGSRCHDGYAREARPICVCVFVLPFIGFFC
jgi:hypothetical protein